MIFRKAEPKDLSNVCTLYQAVIADMKRRGVCQWEWGKYPAEDMLAEDIALGRLYLGEENDALLCAFTADAVCEPEYASVDWLYGVRPGFLHRLAVAPEHQGKGLAGQAVDEAERLLKALGCDALHLDTLCSNERAMALYTRRGMRRVGEVHWRGIDDEAFPCFEKPLTEDCPLLPIPMTPAYRGGALTPWGGDKLRTVYGKSIPNDTTGESLEVSCIPGLESRDPAGATLPELIAAHGEKLVGRFTGKIFPLLLKLLDAREPLSVQVHPDDAYAAVHENGKLGKTEAWLILHAEENAELIYGIKAGTSREELRTACENGAAVAPLLRRVKVRAGDVCFIPAGCVHAICGGILLYEIQQSSDVTYRFYDWDRVDSQGKKRELHLEKALDVTDLDFTLDPVPAPDAPCVRMLDETFFTLDLLHVQGGETALPEVRDFGMLTALEDVTLCAGGVSRLLKKGETVLLPASCPALTLKGNGRAALSMPQKA